MSKWRENHLESHVFQIDGKLFQGKVYHRQSLFHPSRGCFIAHFVLTCTKYGSAQGFLPLEDGLGYSPDVCLKITVECKSVGTRFRVYGISKIMAFRNQKFILLL